MSIDKIIDNISRSMSLTILQGQGHHQWLQWQWTSYSILLLKWCTFNGNSPTCTSEKQEQNCLSTKKKAMSKNNLIHFLQIKKASLHANITD
jgi:hypothetical protein